MSVLTHLIAVLIGSVLGTGTLLFFQGCHENDKKNETYEESEK